MSANLLFIFYLISHKAFLRSWNYKPRIIVTLIANSKDTDFSDIKIADIKDTDINNINVAENNDTDNSDINCG